MDAVTQLREQINRIHADLNMRGIHSEAIADATYSIECLSRAYMDEGIHREWERCHFTPVHRKIGDVLRAHLGKIVPNDHLFDMLYCGRGADDLPDPTIIKVHIHHMRKRLKQYDSAYWVETVFGQGQRLVLKPSEFAATAIEELVA